MMDRYSPGDKEDYLSDILWAVLLLIFVSSFFIFPVHADSVEVIGGGYTYHLIDFGASDAYKRKITSNGRLIENPTFGLLFHERIGRFFYRSVGAFAGSNCLGRPMQGMVYSDGIEIGNFQAGAGLGAYFQESKYFSDLNVSSFRIANIRGVDVVPILGLVFNYKVNLTDSTYIKINNLVGPIITNTLFSLGYNY